MREPDGSLVQSSRCTGSREGLQNSDALELLPSFLAHCSSSSSRKEGKAAKGESSSEASVNSQQKQQKADFQKGAFTLFNKHTKNKNREIPIDLLGRVVEDLFFVLENDSCSAFGDRFESLGSGMGLQPSLSLTDGEGHRAWSRAMEEQTRATRKASSDVARKAKRGEEAAKGE